MCLHGFPVFKDAGSMTQPQQGLGARSDWHEASAASAGVRGERGMEGLSFQGLSVGRGWGWGWGWTLSGGFSDDFSDSKQRHETAESNAKPLRALPFEIQRSCV